MLEAHCDTGGAHITLLCMMHEPGLLHCTKLPLLSMLQACMQVDITVLCGLGRAHNAMRGY